MSVNNYPAATLRKAGLNFVVLPGQIIQVLKNPLSLAIWCYLQSHSEGWIIRRDQIMSHFDIGRHKYDAAMHELRASGLIWTETTRNPETQKMTGKRLVCSNLPQPLAGQYGTPADSNGRSENPTIDKVKKSEGRISRLSGQSTSRANRPVGPSDPLMKDQLLINNQEREIQSKSILIGDLPASDMVEKVAAATMCPERFVLDCWGAFTGHHYKKAFTAEELEGALIKWVARAWNEFGGESAHINNQAGRMVRKQAIMSKKGP